MKVQLPGDRILRSDRSSVALHQKMDGYHRRFIIITALSTAGDGTLRVVLTAGTPQKSTNFSRYEARNYPALPISSHTLRRMELTLLAHICFSRHECFYIMIEKSNWLRSSCSQVHTCRSMLNHPTERS